MLVKVGRNTVLNMDKFERLFCDVEKQEIKKKTSSGFISLFDKYEISRKDEYVMSIVFVFDKRQCRHNTHYTSYTQMMTDIQEVFTQVKAFQPDLVTQAFEEAFFGKEAK